MNKTIAVTGASGFIASHVLRDLEKKGVNIKKVTRKSNLNKALENVDIVINTVGTSAGQTFQEHIEANVAYLSNLCIAANKSKVKKIIHISASALYTNTEYGLSKKLGEEVCKFYSKHNKTKFIILRPPSVYGPGAEKGVVNIFVKLAKKQSQITIFGDGKQKRDFMYIDDLVSAIKKSINYKSDYETFNVGSGKVYSLLDLVSTLEKVSRKKIKIKFEKEKTNYAKQVSSNISAAKKDLKWQAKTSLEEGLKKIILGL